MIVFCSINVEYSVSTINYIFVCCQLLAFPLAGKYNNYKIGGHNMWPFLLFED